MKVSLSVNYPYFLPNGNLFEKILNGVPIKRKNYLDNIALWIKENLVDKSSINSADSESAEFDVCP